MRRLFPFLVFAFLAAFARAQSVRREPSDSGDPNELQLVFQNCSPADDHPQLPSVDGITLGLVGTSSQTSIVNFSITRSTILTYHVRTAQAGPISIPAFTVETDKGAVRVPPYTGTASASSSASADVSSRLEPGHLTVWAGEVFPLTYTLDVSRRTLNQISPDIDWNPAPLVIEEWSKFDENDVFANGEPRLNYITRTRAYAKTPGPVTLNAATQLISIQSGSVGFGLFQMPRVEQLTVTSNTPSLVVRPLPAPAPAGFLGAVGQFKLVSKVIPTTAAVGDPVTWTLELTGTGNWPDLPGLPSREVSKDFNVVQPQAKRTPVDGKLFDQKLTEDVVLIPTRAGSYTLDPVNFVYFDPQSGAYRTITTPATTITITPPAAPPSQAAPAAAESGTAAPASGEAALAAPNFERLKSKTPVFPSGIPRDPLPGSSIALVPMSPRTLLSWLLVPAFSLLAFWLFLAVRRARQTDPLRPQREARARLAQLLAQLKSDQPSAVSGQPDSASAALAAPEHREGGSPLASRLLSWQHATAILFRIPHAAPPAEALAEPDWQTLWIEADRALYAERGELPSDWTARAEAALAAKPLPAFSPLRLFLPQNLLPFVAALALLLTPLLLAPASARADDTDNPEPITNNHSATAAYHRGDFAAAEKAWAAAAAAHPTDTVARYNLSLALAQQDRWAEAAAHAAAAFVQNPSLAPAAWQLAISCENAGYVPAPLAGFLPPGPAESLARLLAPGAWQIAFILAAFLAAAGAGLLLYGAYGRPSRLRRLAAFAILGLGLLLAASAAISLHAYGDVTNRRAVIAWREGVLRSIPTEADTTQKTTPIAPGTVAIGDKTLLGWIRLRFPNGQTGWVRKEEVIPLWQ